MAASEKKNAENSKTKRSIFDFSSVEDLTETTSDKLPLNESYMTYAPKHHSFSSSARGNINQGKTLSEKRDGHSMENLSAKKGLHQKVHEWKLKNVSKSTPDLRNIEASLQSDEKHSLKRSCITKDNVIQSDVKKNESFMTAKENNEKCKESIQMNEGTCPPTVTNDPIAESRRSIFDFSCVENLRETKSDNKPSNEFNMMYVPKRHSLSSAARYGSSKSNTFSSRRDEGQTEGLVEQKVFHQKVRESKLENLNKSTPNLSSMETSLELCEKYLLKNNYSSKDNAIQSDVKANETVFLAKGSNEGCKETVEMNKGTGYSTTNNDPVTKSKRSIFDFSSVEDLRETSTDNMLFNESYMTYAQKRHSFTSVNRYGIGGINKLSSRKHRGSVENLAGNRGFDQKILKSKLSNMSKSSPDLSMESKQLTNENYSMKSSTDTKGSDKRYSINTNKSIITAEECIESGKITGRTDFPTVNIEVKPTASTYGEHEEICDDQDGIHTSLTQHVSSEASVERKNQRCNTIDVTKPTVSHVSGTEAKELGRRATMMDLGESNLAKQEQNNSESDTSVGNVCGQIRIESSIQPFEYSPPSGELLNPTETDTLKETGLSYQGEVTKFIKEIDTKSDDTNPFDTKLFARKTIEQDFATKNYRKTVSRTDHLHGVQTELYCNMEDLEAKGQSPSLVASKHAKACGQNRKKEISETDQKDSCNGSSTPFDVLTGDKLRGESPPEAGLGSSFVETDAKAIFATNQIESSPVKSTKPEESRHGNDFEQAQPPLCDNFTCSSKNSVSSGSNKIEGIESAVNASGIQQSSMSVTSHNSEDSLRFTELQQQHKPKKETPKISKDMNNTRIDVQQMKTLQESQNPGHPFPIFGQTLQHMPSTMHTTEVNEPNGRQEAEDSGILGYERKVRGVEAIENNTDISKSTIPLDDSNNSSLCRSMEESNLPLITTPSTPEAPVNSSECAQTWLYQNASIHDTPRKKGQKYPDGGLMETMKQMFCMLGLKDSPEGGFYKNGERKGKDQLSPSSTVQPRPQLSFGHGTTKDYHCSQTSVSHISDQKIPETRVATSKASAEKQQNRKDLNFLEGDNSGKRDNTTSIDIPEILEVITNSENTKKIQDRKYEKSYETVLNDSDHSNAIADDFVMVSHTCSQLENSTINDVEELAATKPALSSPETTILLPKNSVGEEKPRAIPDPNFLSQQQQKFKVGTELKEHLSTDFLCQKDDIENKEDIPVCQSIKIAGDLTPPDSFKTGFSAASSENEEVLEKVPSKNSETLTCSPEDVRLIHHHAVFGLGDGMNNNDEKLKESLSGPNELEKRDDQVVSQKQVFYYILIRNLDDGTAIMELRERGPKNKRTVHIPMGNLSDNIVRDDGRKWDTFEEEEDAEVCEGYISKNLQCDEQGKQDTVECKETDHMSMNDKNENVECDAISSRDPVDGTKEFDVRKSDVVYDEENTEGKDPIEKEVIHETESCAFDENNEIGDMRSDETSQRDGNENIYYTDDISDMKVSGMEGCYPFENKDVYIEDYSLNFENSNFPDITVANVCQGKITVTNIVTNNESTAHEICDFAEQKNNSDIPMGDITVEDEENTPGDDNHTNVTSDMRMIISSEDRTMDGTGTNQFVKNIGNSEEHAIYSAQDEEMCDERKCSSDDENEIGNIHQCTMAESEKTTVKQYCLVEDEMNLLDIKQPQSQRDTKQACPNSENISHCTDIENVNITSTFFPEVNLHRSDNLVEVCNRDEEHIIEQKRQRSDNFVSNTHNNLGSVLFQEPADVALAITAGAEECTPKSNSEKERSESVSIQTKFEIIKKQWSQALFIRHPQTAKAVFKLEQCAGTFHLHTINESEQILSLQQVQQSSEHVDQEHEMTEDINNNQEFVDIIVADFPENNLVFCSYSDTVKRHNLESDSLDRLSKETEDRIGEIPDQDVSEATKIDSFVLREVEAQTCTFEEDSTENSIQPGPYPSQKNRSDQQLQEDARKIDLEVASIHPNVSEMTSSRTNILVTSVDFSSSSTTQVEQPLLEKPTTSRVSHEKQILSDAKEVTMETEIEETRKITEFATTTGKTGTEKTSTEFLQYTDEQNNTDLISKISDIHERELKEEIDTNYDTDVPGKDIDRQMSRKEDYLEALAPSKKDHNDPSVAAHNEQFRPEHIYLPFFPEKQNDSPFPDEHNSTSFPEYHNDRIPVKEQNNFSSIERRNEAPLLEGPDDSPFLDEQINLSFSVDHSDPALGERSSTIKTDNLLPHVTAVSRVYSQTSTSRFIFKGSDIKESCAYLNEDLSQKPDIEKISVVDHSNFSAVLNTTYLGSTDMGTENSVTEDSRVIADTIYPIQETETKETSPTSNRQIRFNSLSSSESCEILNLQPPSKRLRTTSQSSIIINQEDIREDFVQLAPTSTHSPDTQSPNADDQNKFDEKSLTKNWYSPVNENLSSFHPASLIVPKQFHQIFTTEPFNPLIRTEDTFRLSDLSSCEQVCNTSCDIQEADTLHTSVDVPENPFSSSKKLISLDSNNTKATNSLINHVQSPFANLKSSPEVAERQEHRIAAEQKTILELPQPIVNVDDSISPYSIEVKHQFLSDHVSSIQHSPEEAEELRDEKNIASETVNSTSTTDSDDIAKEPIKSVYRTTMNILPRHSQVSTCYLLLQSYGQLGAHYTNLELVYDTDDWIIGTTTLLPVDHDVGTCVVHYATFGQVKWNERPEDNFTAVKLVDKHFDREAQKLSPKQTGEMQVPFYTHSSLSPPLTPFPQLFPAIPPHTPQSSPQVQSSPGNLLQCDDDHIKFFTATDEHGQRFQSRITVYTGAHIKVSRKVNVTKSFASFVDRKDPADVYHKIDMIENKKNKVHYTRFDQDNQDNEEKPVPANEVITMTVVDEVMTVQNDILFEEKRDCSWQLNADASVGTFTFSKNSLDAAAIGSDNSVLGDVGFDIGKHSWIIKAAGYFCAVGICWGREEVESCWYEGRKWVWTTDGLLYSKPKGIQRSDFGRWKSDDLLEVFLNCEESTVSIRNASTNKKTSLCGFKGKVYPYFNLYKGSSVSLIETSDE